MEKPTENQATQALLELEEAINIMLSGQKLNLKGCAMTSANLELLKQFATNSTDQDNE